MTRWVKYFSTECKQNDYVSGLIGPELGHVIHLDKLFILRKFEREEVKGHGLGPTNSNIESLEILAVLTFSNKQRARPAAFYNDVPTAGKSHKILLISKDQKTPRFQSPNLTNSTLFSLFSLFWQMKRCFEWNFIKTDDK